MIDTFLANTYSTQQIRKRLQALKTALASRFFGGTEESILLEEKNWLETLPQSFFQQFSESKMNDQLAQLEKELQGLATIIIYIAFEISEAEINALGVWIKKNIHPQRIFEIKIDPNVIGGCAFSWKGLYKDYSLRSKIELHREDILTDIKNFQH